MCAFRTLYALDNTSGANYKLVSFNVNNKASSSFAVSKNTFAATFGAGVVDFNIAIYSGSSGGYGYMYGATGLQVYGVTGSTWNLIATATALTAKNADFVVVNENYLIDFSDPDNKVYVYDVSDKSNMTIAHSQSFQLAAGMSPYHPTKYGIDQRTGLFVHGNTITTSSGQGWVTRWDFSNPTSIPLFTVTDNVYEIHSTNDRARNAAGQSSQHLYAVSDGEFRVYSKDTNALLGGTAYSGSLNDSNQSYIGAIFIHPNENYAYLVRSGLQSTGAKTTTTHMSVIDISNKSAPSQSKSETTTVTAFSSCKDGYAFDGSYVYAFTSQRLYVYDVTSDAANPTLVNGSDGEDYNAQITSNFGILWGDYVHQSTLQPAGAVSPTVNDRIGTISPEGLRIVDSVPTTLTSNVVVGDVFGNVTTRLTNAQLSKDTIQIGSSIHTIKTDLIDETALGVDGNIQELITSISGFGKDDWFARYGELTDINVIPNGNVIVSSTYPSILVDLQRCYGLKIGTPQSYQFDSRISSSMLSVYDAYSGSFNPITDKYSHKYLFMDSLRRIGKELQNKDAVSMTATFTAIGALFDISSSLVNQNRILRTDIEAIKAENQELSSRISILSAPTVTGFQIIPEVVVAKRISRPNGLAILSGSYVIDVYNATTDELGISRLTPNIQTQSFVSLLIEKLPENQQPKTHQITVKYNVPTGASETQLPLGTELLNIYTMESNQSIRGSEILVLKVVDASAEEAASHIPVGTFATTDELVFTVSNASVTAINYEVIGGTPPYYIEFKDNYRISRAPLIFEDMIRANRARYVNNSILKLELLPGLDGKYMFFPGVMTQRGDDVGQVVHLFDIVESSRWQDRRPAEIVVNIQDSILAGPKGEEA